MPDDLLRFVGGPIPYLPVVAVARVVSVVLVIVWCTGVPGVDAGPQRLRRIPVVRSLHAALLRRRSPRDPLR